MHKHPHSLIVGVILFASISCVGEIGHEDHSQTLRDTREAVAQALAEGDVERIFPFWTDDVVIYPVSAPAVRGIDAVREYVRRNRQELGVAPRTTPIEIVASESGDLGYIVGTHEWIDRDGRCLHARQIRYPVAQERAGGVEGFSRATLATGSRDG